MSKENITEKKSGKKKAFTMALITLGVLVLAFIVYPFIPKPLKEPKTTKINDTTYNFRTAQRIPVCIC